MHVDYLSISSAAIQDRRNDYQRIFVHEVSYASLGFVMRRMSNEVEFQGGHEMQREK